MEELREIENRRPPIRDFIIALVALLFVGLAVGALVVGILAPIKGFCYLIGGC